MTDVMRRTLTPQRMTFRRPRGGVAEEADIIGEGWRGILPAVIAARSRC